VPTPVRLLRTARKALDRFPKWVRAAAVAAVGVGVVTILRVAGMAVAGEGPSFLGAIGLIAAAIAGGAYLGAVAGITYAIVRDPLRKIGRTGDYAAGVLCVWGTLLAGVIPLQLFIGSPVFPTPDYAAVVAVGGAVIGALIGHVWFRNR
jgi:hypothetical protein